MEYPKIETIFNRDPDDMKHVIWGEFREPAFETVSRWHVTEKVDGTNVRVFLEQTVPQSDGTSAAVLGPCEGTTPRVRFGGRTKDAQMHVSLISALEAMFPVDIVAPAFDPDTSAILFGEGYGPKIQKGGGLYRADQGFRLFDVLVFGRAGRPWWLEWDDVQDIADKLDIDTVPVLMHDTTLDDALKLVEAPSTVAYQDGGAGLPQEGIVARSVPLLFDRRGRRVMWKLKTRDLPDAMLFPAQP